MQVFFKYIFLFTLLSCSQPKGIQKTTSEGTSAALAKSTNLPVWIDYSKSVPDSVQDFFKIYFHSKEVNIIGMKQAIETMMTQSNEVVISKIQSGSKLSENEIKDLVEKSMKNPVCSKLGINLYGKEKSGELIIDSIRWNVIQMPSIDTAKYIKVYTYSPDLGNDKTIYLQLKHLADTILLSGLLK